MALEKVLVVDDDPNICDVLMMYLENEGYSVILSYDGEEALVKFNALKPDIVLLDGNYLVKFVWFFCVRNVNYEICKNPKCICWQIGEIQIELEKSSQLL